MDFHGMKRSELQALCKKHKLPANLKNVEMANRLASLLKVDDEKVEKPQEQRLKPCLRALNDDIVKEGKKVRISPLNQTYEFEKTNPRALRLACRTRKSMVNVVDEIDFEEKVSAVDEPVPLQEKASENASVDNQVKSTRAIGRKPKQAEVVQAELLPKKTARRSSCVADFVSVQPQQSVKTTASEAKPVARRSGRNAEKPVDSVEQVEIVKVPKRKARSNCLVNMVEEKASTRNHTGEKADEGAKEAGIEEAKETRNTRRSARNADKPVEQVEITTVPKRKTRSDCLVYKGKEIAPARNVEKPVESVEQVEIAIVPKGKTISDCLANKGEAKAPTKCSRRNTSKVTGEKAIEGAKEEEIEKAKVTRNTRRQTRGTWLNETVSATESASAVEHCQKKRSTRTAMKRDKVDPEELKDKKSEAAIEGAKEEEIEKAKVNRNTRRQTRGTWLNETVSATESASAVEHCQKKRSTRAAMKSDKVDPGELKDKKSEAAIEGGKEEEIEKAKVTRNTRRQTRGTWLNETVSATESASAVEHCQKKRSTCASMKRDNVDPEELKDKKSEAEVQEKGVPLRNKQTRRQEKSKKTEKLDVQTKCVDKRKMLTIKYAENLQVDPLEKSVESVNNSEAGDIQNMVCNESKAIEVDQGNNQALLQTSSPALLLVECEERSSGTNAKLKELSNEEAKEVNSANESENSDDENSKSDNKYVDPVRDEDINEGEILNAGSSENAEIVLFPSTGFTSPHVVSTVLRSSAEDSQIKLENSASKIDSCVQRDTLLTSTYFHKFTGISLPLSEPGFQGVYEVQHEAVTPSSLIAECDPNDEVSSIKGTESEDKLCADTLLYNEQAQFTWETSIVNSATTKEEGINSDLFLLQGQTSRDDFADLNGIYSELHKSAEIPTSTVVSNEVVGPHTNNCIDQVVTHERANVGYIQAMDEVTLRTVLDEKTESSVSPDPTKEESSSQAIHEATNAGENVGYIQDMDEVTLRKMTDENIKTPAVDDTCISDRSAYPTECEKNHKQGLEEESESQTKHEETNGPEPMNMTDAQLNDIHEDAVMADQNLEGNSSENIMDLDQVIETIPGATDDENAEGIESVDTRSCSDDTDDFQGSQKQGFEKPKSQLAIVEETYAPGSEYREYDTVVINNKLEVSNLTEVSNAELNTNDEEAVLGNQNFEVHEGNGSIVGNIQEPVDCEGIHKQGLEESNSQLTSDEETYDIASLFQSEYAVDDIAESNTEFKRRNLIEYSCDELNCNLKDVSPNSGLQVYKENGESNRKAHDVGEIEEPASPGTSFSSSNSNNEMELVSDLEKLGEFYSDRYNDNFVPQQSAMALKDDAFIDETRQSGHQQFAQMYSWSTEPISIHGFEHMNRTELASRISEDESKKPNDANTPNVHLISPSQNEQADASYSVIQEDSGEVAFLINESLAAASEANSDPTLDGVAVNSEPASADDLMDWEDYSSNAKNKAALTVLHGAEEKSVIQSSVEEANINDQNGAAAELIAQSPEALHPVDSANQAELEDDYFGLEEKSVIQSFVEEANINDENGAAAELIAQSPEALEPVDSANQADLEDDYFGFEESSVEEANINDENEAAAESIAQSPEALHPVDSANQAELEDDYFGLEEKSVIQISVEEANINDENRAAADLIAQSPEALHLVDSANQAELEDDYFGLVDLERIAEQTEQQASSENFSHASKPEESDGEEFLLHVPKEADCEDFSFAPMPKEAVEESFALEEAGKVAPMEKLNKRLEGVCVDSFCSDTLDHKDGYVGSSKQELNEETNFQLFENEDGISLNSAAQVNPIAENKESDDMRPENIDKASEDTFSCLRRRLNNAVEGMEEVTTNIEHVLEEQIKQACKVSTKIEQAISDIHHEDAPKDDKCKSATVKGIHHEDAPKDDKCKSATVKGISKEAENSKSSRKPSSVMKTEKRRIMIHGTPKRPIKPIDMKENSISHVKRECHLGDATALKPPASRRKALGEISRR